MIGIPKQSDPQGLGGAQRVRGIGLSKSHFNLSITNTG